MRVTVRNDLPFARPSETVEIAAAQLDAARRSHTRSRLRHDSDREVLAQALDLEGTPSLIFQTDIKANGARRSICARRARKYRKEDFRVYGRFVRERFDDFAWENDRVAHRMYGAALETWEKEPLTSSTVDVWLKRTRRLSSTTGTWSTTTTATTAKAPTSTRPAGAAVAAAAASGATASSSCRRTFASRACSPNGPIRLVFELRYPDLRSETNGSRSTPARTSTGSGAHY